MTSDFNSHMLLKLSSSGDFLIARSNEYILVFT